MDNATQLRARAERAEASLAALDEAIRGIAGVHPVERILQLVVERVRALADAEYAALGISDEAGVIERFLTSGISDADRARIGALPHGRGLLGLIIREGRSFRIADIAADPRRAGFPAHHPPMHSFLGVPVLSAGRPIGNLYLTNKRSAAEFSAEDQQLVERFALHAGVAMENARMHEQVQRLAVVEERERIGRDLHDGIMQRIYAVTLGLDDVAEQIGEEPDEAAARVERAIDELQATIGEMRGVIYGLEAPTGDGLAAALEALADEMQLSSGLEVEVDIHGRPEVSGPTLRELLQVAREALANVVRHSGATEATLHLSRDADALRLEISDAGRGFDTDSPVGPGHRGLANMRHRAEKAGATLVVDSRPGGGARIILSLPLETQ